MSARRQIDNATKLNKSRARFMPIRYLDILVSPFIVWRLAYCQTVSLHSEACLPFKERRSSVANDCSSSSSASGEMRVANTCWIEV
eukprot:scaffold536045_cov17-Prasinocladus_malaysianus.AAC.1